MNFAVVPSPASRVRTAPMTERRSEEKAMRNRPFGSTKREVAIIGQGTWYLEQGNAETGIAALRRGLDLGMSHIDTAEMYGSGAAESLVGAAIDGDATRFFSFPRCCRPTHRATGRSPPASGRSSGSRPTASIATFCIGAARILFRIRSPRSSSCAPTARFFRGASAISTWTISKRFVISPTPTNSLAIRCSTTCAIEHGVIPWCEANGVAVVAYSPFGHAGGFPEPKSAGGRVLKAIAVHHQATPRQVALSFLTRRASLFAIPKASNPAHKEDNSGAGGLDLRAR
jgi:Aldo/keto reductase family